MRAVGINLLWIDRHSIIQTKCQKDECDHQGCNEKRYAFMVMDLVYGLSNHPVGLLGRPINSIQELTLLAKLLQGRLTSGRGNSVKFSPSTTEFEADVVLELLGDIISDDWWKRGWIFQEKYRAGTRMMLAIPHPESLERLKLTHRDPHGNRTLFGEVEGELCFRSTRFSEEATRFCIAFRNHPTHPPPAVRAGALQKIVTILNTTGKYTLLLDQTEPMTPAIVMAIEEREMSKRWDRLPITANCCPYATRLDFIPLRRYNESLSLSILALCLLNGEVLDNGKPADPMVSAMTVSQYLKSAIFNRIRGPMTQRSLTFNKSCRLFDVSFSESGIHTQGHLWKLGKVIETSRYPPEGAWVDSLDGNLDPGHRKQLACLVEDLASSGHIQLAKELSNYLDNDARAFQCPNDASLWPKPGGLVERYMRMMAEELAEAIAYGKHLRLGFPWDASYDGRRRSYTAVFVWDRDGTTDGDYVFAASCPEGSDSEEYDFKDLDRHVSFEVDVQDITEKYLDGRWTRLPELRIRRWVSGLCFFRGRPRNPVIFPWPPDLAMVGR